VSISDTGDVLLVGASASTAGGTDSGQAQRFVFDSTNYVKEGKTKNKKKTIWKHLIFALPNSLLIVLPFFLISSGSPINGLASDSVGIPGSLSLSSDGTRAAIGFPVRDTGKLLLTS
jgi:hypothetical protein